MATYKIYLIRGVKVGCTKEYPKRVIVQGYREEDAEILEEHDDIETASRREIELQTQYFGKRDNPKTYLNTLKAQQKGTESRQTKGFSISPEGRKKFSEAAKEAWIKGTRKGHKHSEETKAKMRHPKSKETIEKMCKAQRGKIVSDETKKNMSEAQKKYHIQKRLEKL